jgi:hypothetical protein
VQVAKDRQATDTKLIQQEAIKLLQRMAADQQQQQQQDPQQSSQPTSNLRARLMASDAERQRLQQELDALSISHEALTTRCALLEAALAPTSSGSSTSALACGLEQLQALHQQLAKATRYGKQQQKTNKQLAQQLQQAQDKHREMEQRLAADAAALAAVQEELAMAQEGIESSKWQVRALSRQVKELTAARVKQDRALAAAEAAAHTLQQQNQRLQHMKEDMVLQLTAARNQARTAVAAAAEQFSQDRRQLLEQAAAAAQAAAKARAGWQAACRDEGAVLVVVQRLTVQQMMDQTELKQVKEQLEAAQAEAQRTSKQAAEATKKAEAADAARDTMCTEAERARYRALVASVHQSQAEHEVRLLKMDCQRLQNAAQHWERMAVTRKETLVEYERSAAEQVARLKEEVEEMTRWWREGLDNNRRLRVLLESNTASRAAAIAV